MGASGGEGTVDVRTIAAAAAVRSSPQKRHMSAAALIGSAHRGQGRSGIGVGVNEGETGTGAGAGACRSAELDMALTRLLAGG